MKYIKTFDQHTQYEEYIDTPERVRPNISYCKDTGDVHYDSIKYIQAIYNVEDISTPTKLFNYVQDEITASNEFESVVIDNISVPLSSIESGTYQFEETGQHIVKFYIPLLTTLISNSLFKACTDIIEILIPYSNIDTIGEEAFSNCTNITKVTLPISIKVIKKNAFYGTTKLSDINLQNVTTLEERAFNSSGITEANLSSLTKSIPSFAFMSCNNLIKVNISNSVTTIERNAFTGCGHLPSIVVPNSVTSIGYNAFYYCGQLRNITLSQNLSYIDEGAFGYVTNATITIYATTPPTLGNNALPQQMGNIDNIYVPSESISAYESASGWNSFAGRFHPIQ